MSTIIQQELASRGVADVIIFVKPTTASKVTAGAAAALAAPAGTAEATDVGGAVRALAKHFQSSELSQTSQLAAAASSGRPLHAAARTTHARAAAPPSETPPGPRYYPNLGVMLGTATREGIAALRADARVDHVAGAPPVSLIRPSRKAAVQFKGSQTWGLRAMRVERLWKKGLSGKGILVGHLDTGVDGKHPALKKAIALFAEFDDLGREVQPAPVPFDTDDHGTHTAATIAGRPQQGRHIGVAPGADLASAIVIEGGDVVARVLGGMDWAVGNGVKILSMSLGFRGFWDDFMVLTQLLRSRGILPVFAVGNEGPGTSRSPGNYSEALSVGAHGRDRQVAEFSSSQRFQRTGDPIVPDVVLPGVSVVSARPGGGYQSMDGTSMATPHLAGLAALLMEAFPDRSIDDVEQAIFDSSRRSSQMLEERASRGIPDGEVALSLLEA
jgi:subtilisin family serine protease